MELCMSPIGTIRASATWIRATRGTGRMAGSIGLELRRTECGMRNPECGMKVRALRRLLLGKRPSPVLRTPSPHPMGIRLLGIGQRRIVASRAGISAKRNPRKAFPSTPQTLGDYLQVKRLENGLCLRQVADNLEVPISLVRAWEF